MDQTLCPEGQRSLGRARVDNGDLYYLSMRGGTGCPRGDKCLTRSERTGQAPLRGRVYLSDVRKGQVVDGEAGKAWRREQLKVRDRIEPRFDQQMNRHGLRPARYWELAKVTLEVPLNWITVNAKRAARLLA